MIHDLGLDDDIAFFDGFLHRIKNRSVQRMVDHANELGGVVQYQVGISVKGDHILEAAQHTHIGVGFFKTGVFYFPAAEQPVELLQLSPLSFPAHIPPLRGVPPAFPDKQREFIRDRRDLLVEFTYAGNESLFELRVVRHVLFRRVCIVCQQSEVQIVLPVGQILFFQPADKLHSLFL